VHNKELDQSFDGIIGLSPKSNFMDYLKKANLVQNRIASFKFSSPKPHVTFGAFDPNQAINN
jgi:hypothetical protein